MLARVLDKPSELRILAMLRTISKGSGSRSVSSSALRGPSDELSLKNQSRSSVGMNSERITVLTWIIRSKSAACAHARGQSAIFRQVFERRDD